MTEIVRDSSTSVGMTKRVLDNKRTFWALAALMLVLFAIANLPWQLDDYDQAKQAWTSYEMVTEGHWFYQRTSDDQGIATKPPLTGWMSAMQHGVSPAQVALAFATSTERYGNNAIYDYEHFLGRMPSALETANVTALLKAGATDQDVVTAFVASSEYNNFRSGGDLGVWVSNMYRDVLGRPASPAEVDAWLLAMGLPPASGPAPSTGNCPPTNVDPRDLAPAQVVHQRRRDNDNTEGGPDSPESKIGCVHCKGLGFRRGDWRLMTGDWILQFDPNGASPVTNDAYSTATGSPRARL